MPSGIDISAVAEYNEIEFDAKRKVIFSRKKSGTDVERILVAAPIKIGDVDYYMGVMLQRDSAHQRLYLHNVATITKEEATTTSQDDSLTNWSDEGDSLLLTTIILQKAMAVKKELNKISSAESTMALRHAERGDMSGRRDALPIANYTEEEYNNYSWARANDILTAGENKSFESQFADAVAFKFDYRKTASGEYMIPVEDTDESPWKGFQRKIVFAKGTMEAPIITRVLEMYLFGSKEIEEKRSEIYALERKGLRQKTCGVFAVYTKADVRTYAKHKRKSNSNVGYNDRLGTDRRASARETEALAFRERLLSKGYYEEKGYPPAGYVIEKRLPRLRMRTPEHKPGLPQAEITSIA